MTPALTPDAATPHDLGTGPFLTATITHPDAPHHAPITTDGPPPYIIDQPRNRVTFNHPITPCPADGGVVYTGASLRTLPTCSRPQATTQLCVGTNTTGQPHEFLPLATPYTPPPLTFAPTDPAAEAEAEAETETEITVTAAGPGADQTPQLTLAAETSGRLQLPTQTVTVRRDTAQTTTVTPVATVTYHGDYTVFGAADTRILPTNTDDAYATAVYTHADDTAIHDPAHDLLLLPE